MLAKHCLSAAWWIFDHMQMGEPRCHTHVCFATCSSLLPSTASALLCTGRNEREGAAEQEPHIGESKARDCRLRPRTLPGVMQAQEVSQQQLLLCWLLWDLFESAIGINPVQTHLKQTRSRSTKTST